MPDTNTTIAIYGLLGRKLGHSWSPKYFEHKFRDEQINAEYRLFEVDDICKCREVLSKIDNLKGFNVTIPYKSEIIPLLDYVDPTATDIGAVNVVRCGRSADNSLILSGYNTDWEGFVYSLQLHFDIKDIRGALILGTGGAAKAVAAGLKSLGIKFLFVSRNSKSENTVGYEDISLNILKDYNLIVNATPAGMWPDVESYPPLPYQLLTSDNLCFDLTYNPPVTCFMRKSQAQGAKVAGGLGMLEAQAELAWNIWNA